MKKYLKQFAIFAAVFSVAAAVGADAFAQSPVGVNIGNGGGNMTGSGGDAGSGFLSDLQSAINGSMGTTAGLVVSLVGLYMWIWNQVSWGLVVAIGGALITAFPGIYKNIGNFGKSAFSSSITEGAQLDHGEVNDK